MSYVVESGSSQRARKRRRTAITLLVAVALLAVAFYYASSYFKKQPTASAACSSATRTTPAPAVQGGPPSPGQITVNVYNATGRDGLAGDAAKTVKARGFVVGTVANDPARKQVAGTAEVRYGKNGEAAAKVVSALVAGAAPVTDARADASVDLVLGSGFTTIAAPAAPGGPAAPPTATAGAKPGATAGATAPPTSAPC